MGFRDSWVTGSGVSERVDAEVLGHLGRDCFAGSGRWRGEKGEDSEDGGTLIRKSCKMM